MARKITQDAVAAFLAGEPFKLRNTEVIIHIGRRLEVDSYRYVRDFSSYEDWVELKLNGNQIAQRYLNPSDDPLGHSNLWVSTGDFDTRTTKERLNGLPGVHVNHSKGHLHLNGKPWSGALKYVIS